MIEVDFETVRYCSGLSCQQLYCNSISSSFLLFYSLQNFTFSIQIMFSLILSDANDPQGLMRH